MFIVSFSSTKEQYGIAEMTPGQFTHRKVHLIADLLCSFPNCWSSYSLCYIGTEVIQVMVPCSNVYLLNLTRSRYKSNLSKNSPKLYEEYSPNTQNTQIVL